MLVDDPPPAKPIDAPVTVIVNADAECPHEELGILSASSGLYEGGSGAFLEAMKKKARNLGGDAILLGDVTAQTTRQEPKNLPPFNEDMISSWGW